MVGPIKIFNPSALVSSPLDNFAPTKPETIPAAAALKRREMGGMGAEGGEGAGAGAGGNGAGEQEWFKCLYCTMEAGFFDRDYINIHKANHQAERKKALANQAKQAAARKKEAKAKGKPAKKAGKGKPAKKAGKGSSHKSGARDKRCYSK